MSLDNTTRTNVILDVRCCVKGVLVAEDYVPTRKFTPDQVPNEAPPAGYGVSSGAAWQRIARLMIQCLKEKGYEVDDMDLGTAQRLVSRPVRHTADYLRASIYKSLS